MIMIQLFLSNLSLASSNTILLKAQIFLPKLGFNPWFPHVFMILHRGHSLSY